MQGVANDRLISLADLEMRHGRKSSTQRIDGYKRHVLRDLDSGLVRAVGITAANAPESWMENTMMGIRFSRERLTADASIT